MNEQTPAPAQKVKAKQKKTGGSTWILLLMMILGAAIMAYPTVSDWWNSFHATQAIASYSRQVEATNSEELSAMLDEARAYNRSLLDKENPFAMTDEDMEEYQKLLNLSGTGLMGYIQVPSIKINVPIYHTTEESVLQVAAGHVEWTALPVGGESTHSVLSGHRGLPSARLFTDLDKMKEGDRFTITVLNQTVTYEVDQIRIVEPGDISELRTIPGKDYCTLVTCTPYGINSHRLLVRGYRVPNEVGELTVAPEAVMIPHYLTIPAVGIPLLFVFLAVMLIVTGRKKPGLSKNNDSYDDSFDL